MQIYFFSSSFTYLKNHINFFAEVSITQKLYSILHVNNFYWMDSFVLFYRVFISLLFSMISWEERQKDSISFASNPFFASITCTVARRILLL